MRYVTYEKKLFFGLSEHLVIDSSKASLSFSRIKGQILCSCDDEAVARKICNALNVVAIKGKAE